MSRSYVETFFRHKYLLLLPIVLGLVVGTALAFQAPRKYVSNASFWADTRVPEESTMGTTGGQSWPSSGQAALLQQYLNTRSFMSSVLQVSPLAEEFRAADAISAERLLATVAGEVAVSTPGPQLVIVTVTTTDPEEAKGVASAVLTQFEEAQIAQTVTRAKARVEYDRQQMQSARRALDRSENDQTRDQYAAAVAAYEASAAAVNSAGSSGIQVIDKPDLALPQARRTTIMFGAVGGMLAGFTLSILALILLMTKDRSVRGESDAQDALGLDVVGSIPHVKRMPAPDRTGARVDPLVGLGS
ncbi:MAG: hypothetical protein WCF12_13160 [Propionicimonas sp.]